MRFLSARASPCVAAMVTDVSSIRYESIGSAPSSCPAMRSMCLIWRESDPAVIPSHRRHALRLPAVRAVAKGSEEGGHAVSRR